MPEPTSNNDEAQTSTARREPGARDDETKEQVLRAIRDCQSLRELAAGVGADPTALGRQVASGTSQNLAKRVRELQFRRVRRRVVGLQVKGARRLHRRLRAGRGSKSESPLTEAKDLALDLPSWGDLSTLMEVSKQMQEIIDDQLDDLQVFG